MKNKIIILVFIAASALIAIALGAIGVERFTNSPSEVGRTTSEAMASPMILSTDDPARVPPTRAEMDKYFDAYVAEHYPSKSGSIQAIYKFETTGLRLRQAKNMDFSDYADQQKFIIFIYKTDSDSSNDPFAKGSNSKVNYVTIFYDVTNQNTVRWIRTGDTKPIQDLLDIGAEIYPATPALVDETK